MTEPADTLELQAEETLHNLARSHDCLLGDLQRFFQGFGLTPQQFNVLRVLSRCPESKGLACQEVAEKLLNRVPDTTRLLDRLQQAGWIRRVRCCHDRRVVRTRLTPAGVAKVQEVEGPLREVLCRRLSHMTPHELSELNRLVRKLRESGCQQDEVGAPDPGSSAPDE